MGPCNISAVPIIIGVCRNKVTKVLIIMKCGDLLMAKSSNSI